MLDRDLVSRRFADCESPWLRSFSLEALKVLVVCRGPVRLEAFQVFDEIGVREYGMLLSEKDSVVYPRCLAPELRCFRFPQNVHRVPDYTGAGQEQKKEQHPRDRRDRARPRLHARVRGLRLHGRGRGAGRGDRARGRRLHGPVVARAAPRGREGRGEEARAQPRQRGDPGRRRRERARAARAKVKDRSGAREDRRRSTASTSPGATGDTLEENAEALLQAGYAKSVELVTHRRAAEARPSASAPSIWRDYPTHRIRFKYIGGGGGKGQRVVSKPDQIAAAVMDVCAESKVIEPGSNRNFLIELNIERTRHNEIQLIGNGDWCLSLGGRDCSVQMHEQKLVEVSLTKELLDAEIERATRQDAPRC